MAGGLQARRYYVSGLVQGVGYRFFAERVARELGVGGYVRNLADGRVEVYAVGTAAQLEALGQRLRQGPPAAVVRELVEEPAELLPRYRSAFSILTTSS